MLTMGQEKMSKSVGNIVTIRELREHNPGEALRYALLSGHYRSPLAWSNDLLTQARASLDGLYQALLDAPAGNGTANGFREVPIADVPAGVLEPLLDDLNTPQALAGMHALAGELNRAAPGDKPRARDRLLAAGWLLGLLERLPADHFRSGDIDVAEVERLIVARDAARAARDFTRVDEVRDQLLALGVELEDTRTGTRWKLR
jgi:cysteinyl-tRNA synthetase